MTRELWKISVSGILIQEMYALTVRKYTTCVCNP